MVYYVFFSPQAPPSPPRPEHNHVLEHSLHQLLREQHYRNSYLPMPHPVTALLGMSKRRRIAGPQGTSRNETAGNDTEVCMSQGVLLLFLFSKKCVVITYLVTLFQRSIYYMIALMSLFTAHIWTCKKYNSIVVLNSCIIIINISYC